EEDERLFGDGIIQFGGVLAVVAADADDFAGCDRRQKTDLVEAPCAIGRAPGGEDVAGDFADGFGFDETEARLGQGATVGEADLPHAENKGLEPAEFHRAARWRGAAGRGL